MRIRKNAKISRLLMNTNTNVVINHADECLLQNNLCQLNQSPWDIITFPSSDSSSSFHQLDDNEFYYNVSLAVNGISIDSSVDFDSVPSVKNFEGENYDFVDPKNDYEESLRSEGVVTNDNQEEIMLCDKTDDKGWQCGKVVKNGESVCDDHHQASVKLQNHALCTTTKKKPKPKPKPKPNPVHGSVEGSRARSQTKKRTSTTNPYEFYYYSGFGPSWGKKRGTGSTTGSNEPTKVIKETSLTNDEMDIQNEEGKLFESEVSKVGGPTKMELAHMDDDDQKKSKTGINGKKRGRKPIKARSLKSLM